MSILNITNLTDEPEGWILDKFENAFEELEEELGITIDKDEQRDFIDSQIENLEDAMNETKGSELLGIIDNYLVNLDYYAEVKEWYTNYARERLDYLRQEIKAERISYAEIAELQSLAKLIPDGDVELLEWAGVEENHND